jgi:two-component system response regulator AtoC
VIASPRVYLLESPSIVSRIVIDDETAPLDARSAGLSLLVVVEGAGVVHPLPPQGTITIGRSEDNDVRVDHPSVSRRHAALDVGPPLRVRDLGSQNGTRVASRDASQKPVVVEAGDVIEVGGVWIIVHDPASMANVARPSTPALADLERAGQRLIVEDPAMKRVLELVERVAQSTLSVLILGETGVGKELIAEALHRLSRRPDGPFVRLNCAALPRALLESELFGHERGAFTGATEAKAGLFETASGGTLFLDEIGEIPLDVQVALLRVLEDRRVLRVGGREPRAVDVRFVSATNRDLRAESDSGRFRRDLYFRLNGMSIVVPPLRERTSEIPALARFFAASASAQMGRARSPRVTDDAAALMRAYDWPGNIRELKNVVERAVVLAPGDEIEPQHLPPEVASRAPSVPPGAAPRDSGVLRAELEDLERKRILDALDQCNGNQTKAAELLGMPRRTFVKRLDAYGIARPRKDSKHD